MSDIAKVLGARIRAYRTAAGISQEELAFKAGISPAHLGQIERGVKRPNVETVEKLARSLGVPMSVLFEAESAPEEESSVTLNKIMAQLSSMPESQQKDVLKMIRILRRMQDGE